jgi:tellurite resistance protein TerB
MSHQKIRNRCGMTRPEIMAAYLEHRDNELLDGVISGAALIAAADGRVEPAERRQLLDFLRRNSLLVTNTRTEVLDFFERRVREVEQPRGAEAVVEDLARLVGRSPARFIVEAGREIAIADRCVDPREQHALQLIRTALGLRRLRSEGELDRAEGAP